MRLGTYVINVPFWNSALLAREFATVDRLSGGRVEVGLGSGHLKSEFDAAGIAWQPFGARADRLAAAVDELVEQLHATRERYGISYFVTHGHSADAFSQVIEQVRA